MSDSKQLALAVNHALNDRRISDLRMGIVGGTMGSDGKRGNAYCEFGFKESLTALDFYNMYTRGGIANGAVNKLTGNCWKTDPWIIEGDDANESDDETAWEDKVSKTISSDFWHAFMEADKRRLVCRYSALILRIKDSKKFNQPVSSKNNALVEAIPVWAGALKPIKYETNETSDNYGKPSMWQYTETDAEGNNIGTKDIHPDRIIILGDYSKDAVGFLEPAYNNLVSIEKVEGGSGESFLKNASRQMNINFDKEVDLRQIANAYGVQLEDLQEAFNETATELNRGNDMALITQGASVTPMVANVPDPTPSYTINLQSASATFDISSKILVGNQTGERASTEDWKQFNSTCQSRRNGPLARDIRGSVKHLMRIGVIDRISEFKVKWDDLTDATNADKLGNAKTMSEINATALASATVVFTDAEIRVAAGYEPELPADATKPKPLPTLPDPEATE